MRRNFHLYFEFASSRDVKSSEFASSRVVLISEEAYESLLEVKEMYQKITSQPA
jgi:hypothetical protein